MKKYAISRLIFFLVTVLILVSFIPLKAGEAAKEKKKKPADLVEAIPANILNSKSINLSQEMISYAGYIEVNKKRRDHLFYWFFESRNSKYVPKEKKKNIPLVIWLTGGPGASSMIGLLQENGPFRITESDTGTIETNPYSWNEECHVIYWDQPIGTGYSYSETNHYVNSEKELANQFYKGMQGFYKLHPEYRQCDLYVTGESYSGKYIPNIVRKIMEMNTKNKEKPHLVMNLKGLAIGDGWMFPKLQTRIQIEHAFAFELIDTLQKKKINKMYNIFVTALKDKHFHQATTIGNEIGYTIVRCGGNPNVYDVRSWTDLPLDTTRAYLDSKAVKEALHVPKCQKWQNSDGLGEVEIHLYNDEMTSITHLFTPFLNSGLRLLFYSGNFDLSCMGTESVLQHIKWCKENNWKDVVRKIWVTPPKKTLGFVKSKKNLMQVSIPMAGHMVPISKPKVSRMMINNWIFKREFVTYTPYIPKSDGTKLLTHSKED